MLEITSCHPRQRAWALFLALLLGFVFLMLLIGPAFAAPVAQIATGDRYVAVSGSDELNDCTDPDFPCLTVGRALSQADPYDTIRVAEGLYVENLVVYEPVNLEGGYEAVNWTRDIEQYVTILDGSNGQTIPGDWDGDAVRYPMVIEHGDGYRLYYNNGELGGAIGLASSPDGLIWTRHPANPVLVPGQPGDWDGGRLEAPFVLRQGVNNYLMWYSGYDGCGIGLATSSDGVNWTKHPANPVLVPGDQWWNNVCVQHPTVIYEDGHYKMWMMTVGDTGSGALSTFSYATSPDGVNWTSNNPVFNMQPANPWESEWIWRPYVLRLAPNPYQLWYTGFSGGVASIGYATSPDGVNWVRHNGGVAPVLAGTPGEWDDGFAADPAVGFVVGNVFAMYYDNNHSIGLAHSPDGINWTKSPANPVFTPGAPTQWGYSVVLFNAGSDGAVLDGFTVTHGDACATGGGGGVGIEGVAVTIQNSIIRENNAAGPCGGGGVEVRHPSGFVSILHSQIISNTAADAGGLDVWNESTAYVYDTLIADNSARGGLPGGGVEVSWNSVLTIENSTINNNATPSHGGGIAVDSQGQATITNCEIQGNHSDSMGGGIWAGENSVLLLAGSPVFNNTAQGSGGGVTTERAAQVAITDSVIAGNVSSSAGGGVVLSGETALLADSQVLYNQAGAWAGGVWVASGQAHIVNALIEGNQAFPNSGGGIEINGDWGPVYLLLEHSVLQGNIAQGNGGGLHVWHSAADVVDVQFLNNHSLGEGGGGVAASNEGEAVVSDSLFSGNEAMWGGGLFAGQLSVLRLERSAVTANTAADSGGGLWIDEGSTAIVNSSWFEFNSAASQGGGLWHYGPLTMMDTAIRYNQAGNIGGGVTSCCPEGGGALDMTNCLVADNEGTYGGGIAPFWHGTLTNVTVAHNVCTAPDCVGGVDATRNEANQQHWFRSAVLWGNANSDLACETGYCRADASDIGVGGAYSGVGNLSTDPHFVDAANGDYHLAAWSPVINAGTALGAPDHDFDGDPRPLGYGFDMGYDEFAGTPDPLYVDVFTNQSAYGPGDMMTVGLEVVNATAQSRPGYLRLTLSTPWGDQTILTMPMVRPAKSTLWLPNLFTITLPSLPDGQYAWLLSWLPYGESDSAPWTFTSPLGDAAR